MNFRYLNESPHVFLDEVFFVQVDPGITDKTDLFNFYYRAMWFPGYFGFNWDAMYDFLCDISWIKKRRILIIHERLPKMEVNDMRKYFSVLNDACDSWSGKNYYLHDFQVYFDIADKDIVEKFIVKIQQE